MSDYQPRFLRAGFPCAVLCATLILLFPLSSGSCGQEETNRGTPGVGTPDESIALLKRVGSAFASVTERVSPSVVGIESQKRVLRATREKAATEPPDLSGEDFFEYFFHRGTPQPETPQREYIQRAQGSGFIISPDGYILTNNHVVAGAQKVVAELVDGRTMDVEVVGTDPESDVAVVRIKADKLTPVALGNSDALEVGEWVLAVGNPLGLSHTVTAGIVSAKHRSGFNVTTYENFIQTDAAVNMGNSGGPLVNLNGQVVGMNTFILGPAGGNIGIGFAIPINIAKDVADQLIKTGAVERGYLGLIPQDLTAELAEAFDLKDVKGAVIAQVTEDSAAARAGLVCGDIIPQFDGMAIESAAQFRNLVAGRKPGQKVELVVVRDGARRTLEVTLDKRPGLDELRGRPREAPKPPPQELPRPLGLTVQDLTAEKAQRSGLKDQIGVVIAKVAAGSEAAEKGLREGYVIRQINRREVTSEPQFKEAVTQALGAKRHLLLLITDGKVSLYVVLNPTEE